MSKALQASKFLNDPNSSEVGYLPAGTGAVATDVQSKLRESVSVKDFGAIGDGVTDNTAAFAACIAVAGASKTIDVPSGVYCLSQLNAAVAGLHIKGAKNGFTYGVGPGGTILKFTAPNVAVNTYANPGDATNAPYVTLENLAIDCNNIATVGFDGGFVCELRNVSIVRATVANLRLGALSQSSLFDRCAFNGGLDGILSLGELTSMYFTNCVTRENTRYGVNGSFPSSNFHNHTFESNGSSGCNLTGTCSDLSFTGTCYFEQNDFALGANGYQVRANLLNSLQGVMFLSTVFGSTGITKIANIESGKVKFSRCQQTGSSLTEQITANGAADVMIEDSFDGYPMPGSVKVVPGVQVDAASSVFLGTTSDFIVTNSPAIIFGTGDFSVNFIIEPDNSGATLRTVCSGNPGAFEIGLSGSAYGMTSVNFSISGSAVFHSTPLMLRNNVPVMLTYSRSAGTAYLLKNGVVIDSFADTNNYSVTQATIGSNVSTLGTQGLQGRLYAFSYFSVALSFSQVMDLWRSGGNAGAAKLTASFDLRFDVRPPGKIWNPVTPTWLAFQGAGNWSSPNPQAVVATGSAAAVPAGMLSLGTGTTTSVGASGVASALPTNPAGYLIVYFGPDAKLVPYYTP